MTPAQTRTSPVRLRVSHPQPRASSSTVRSRRRARDELLRALELDGAQVDLVLESWFFFFVFCSSSRSMPSSLSHELALVPLASLSDRVHHDVVLALRLRERFLASGSTSLDTFSYSSMAHTHLHKPSAAAEAFAAFSG